MVDILAARGKLQIPLDRKVRKNDSQNWQSQKHRRQNKQLEKESIHGLEADIMFCNYDLNRLIILDAGGRKIFFNLLRFNPLC
jgi:hypothetical protein